jgi:hypothetical protein
MTASLKNLEGNNDVVMEDISGLINNFQKLFITFTKNNYETFTEKDVQRLVNDELKTNLFTLINQL